MAGLLGYGGYTPDPIGLGLLEAGTALMTSRQRGGGVPAAFSAFNQGAMAGLGAQRALQQDARRNALTDAQLKAYEAQQREREMAVAALDAQRAKQAQFWQMLSGGNDAVVAQTGGLAPTKANAELRNRQMRITPEIAAMAAQAGIDLDTLKKVAESSNFGRDKIAHWVESAGPNGPVKLGISDYGDQIGVGIEQPVKLDSVDTGGAIQFRNPYLPSDPITKTLGPGDVQQAKDAAASRWVTMRGQDMTDARAREANAATKPADIFKMTEGMRKEFSALPEVKSYKEVVPVINSAKKAADNASGDISIIYAVGKVMDPNSVVREGEMNLVIKSGSPAERVLGLFNYVKNGGRLTPAQRQNLLAELDMRARAYETAYTGARKSYEGIVQRNNLNPQDVFPEIPGIEATAAPVVDFKDMGKGGKGSQSSGPRVINFGDLTGM